MKCVYYTHIHTYICWYIHIYMLRETYICLEKASILTWYKKANSSGNNEQNIEKSIWGHVFGNSYVGKLPLMDRKVESHQLGTYKDFSNKNLYTK